MKNKIGGMEITYSVVVKHFGCYGQFNVTVQSKISKIFIGKQLKKQI